MKLLNKENHHQFKHELYTEFSRIGHSLSHPKRLEILDLLAQSTYSVEMIAESLDVSIASTSQHLQILKSAKLVRVSKQGTYAFYSLNDASVYQLVNALRHLAHQHLAEVDSIFNRYLGKRDLPEDVDIEELLRRVKTGKVILLDVRPKAEYDALHLSGARPMPLEILEQHLKDLPKHREIVVYCRGAYCVFADQAVTFLKSKGYKAWRLAQGPMDWKLAGFPVLEAA
jgi:rhodanese-related sulfurtransferase/DNA-binding transcriptional ArsR family regulator